MQQRQFRDVRAICEEWGREAPPEVIARIGQLLEQANREAAAAAERYSAWARLLVALRPSPRWLAHKKGRNPMQTHDTVTAMRARLEEVVKRSRERLTPEQRAEFDARVASLKKPEPPACKYCGKPIDSGDIRQGSTAAHTSCALRRLR